MKQCNLHNYTVGFLNLQMPMRLAQNSSCAQRLWRPSQQKLTSKTFILSLTPSKFSYIPFRDLKPSRPAIGRSQAAATPVSMQAHALRNEGTKLHTPLKGSTLAAVLAEQLSTGSSEGRREDLLVIFAALQVLTHPCQ